MSNDKSEQVRLDFSDTGISFHVTDKTKSFQTSSHIASTLFDEYSMEGQTDSVTCNLEPFSKCVSIFGNSMLLTTTLQMTYSSNEKCIKLILDENESSFPLVFIVECIANVRFGLLPPWMTCQIMRHCFRKKTLFWERLWIQLHWNALFSKSSRWSILRKLNYRFIRKAGFACLVVMSRWCKWVISLLSSYDGYLDNHSSVLSEFHCKGEKSWKYNRQLFLRCGKPLSLSCKTFIRVNANGIVCIQHLINDDAESPLFVDCFLHPLDAVD